MRYWFLFIAATTFGTAALAQVEITEGLEVSNVIHEPNASQVGEEIASIEELNPNYDPLQPTGEPQFIGVYGNGNGLTYLPDESKELYALAGTTTHDLIEITNNSGQTIEFDMRSGVILLRAKGEYAELAEQGSPDPAARHETFAYGFSEMTTPVPAPPVAPQTILVPNGGTEYLLLFRSKWGDRLDTSPREYIATFVFEDLTTGQDVAFEVDLIVPKPEDREGSGCVVTHDRELPTGLWVIAAGGIAALATRRQKLKKARTGQP